MPRAEPTRRVVLDATWWPEGGSGGGGARGRTSKTGRLQFDHVTATGSYTLQCVWSHHVEGPGSARGYRVSFRGSRSSRRAVRCDLFIRVWRDLVEILEELPDRFRRHVLAGFEAGASDRDGVETEPRHGAALFLQCDLGGVRERRLRHLERGGTQQEFRLWRWLQAVREREKTHRQLVVRTQIGSIRRAEQRVPLRERELRD